jgi:dienelactone hydrolase
MPTNLPYSVQGRPYTGYLADGSKGKRVPGVLVIHEASGLGPHARKKADMLAEAGYVAFAADLFGEPVTDLARASAFVSQLSQDWSELRTRCNGALDVLRQQPHVDTDRLAAIGFCFGGMAALELGRSGADLRAIVGFHSGLKTARPEDSKNIEGKALVCLGDADPLVPREVRDGFVENMTASKVDCQILLMSGVGHSFTNPDAEAFGVPGCHYDAKADRRSWAAMKQLFDEAFKA